MVITNVSADLLEIVVNPNHIYYVKCVATAERYSRLLSKGSDMTAWSLLPLP